MDKKVDRRDKWWDPVDGSTSDIPANVSPGIIPVLARVLAASLQHRITRFAALSRPAVHIKGVWGFDMGWGCGYRNALMALSALLYSQPAYRSVFARDVNGADPGVRRIQGWIEQAWENGYDRIGSDHFKGKLLGTRKWIGTTDLYTMFTSKGIPCELYDFPKPKVGKSGPRTAHIALQQWVRNYFLEEDDSPPLERSSRSGPSQRSRSAFDVMMRTDQEGVGRGEAIRLSARYPLILQHSGHSRTIIGYEENASGNINLLLFDPAKTMPKDVRAAGIQEQLHNRQQPSRPPLPANASSGSKSGNSVHESIPFSRPFTNGASEAVYLDASTLNGDREAYDNVSDEEIDRGGWVKKKVDQVFQRRDNPQQSSPRPLEGPVTKSLGFFRANLGALG